MKGTFFSKPLEWSIETKGESWEQGKEIEGHLIITNTSQSPQALLGPFIAISLGEFKKVQARNDDAFKPVLNLELPIKELKSQEKFEFPFKLQLPTNCSVTDKKSSLYLIYGQNNSCGQLQLMIKPRELFNQVISLFDTFFRFKLKEVKSGKNCVEFKLTPPSSRDLANLESLSINSSMNEDVMNLQFEFGIKKLEASTVGNKITKSTQKVSKAITPKEYSLGKNMINQDKLLKIIESTLGEVKLNNIF